ncbi:hypothetical protein EDB85DRAFT_2140126 [Lactarius pseudohatsudake]|nr:hypothetical protein EDB85DRAFT_2140126 [Lactarius pseudohatsudake]
MAQPVQPGSESQPDSHHVDDQLADIADQVLDQVPNLPVTDMDNIITQQAQQQQQQVIDRLDAMLAGIDNLRATANNLLEVVNNLQAQVGALQAGVDALQAGVGALQAGAGALQARAGSAQWTWRRVDKLGIIIIVRLSAGIECSVDRFMTRRYSVRRDNMIVERVLDERDLFGTPRPTDA